MFSAENFCFFEFKKIFQCNKKGCKEKVNTVSKYTMISMYLKKKFLNQQKNVLVQN